MKMLRLSLAIVLLGTTTSASAGKPGPAKPQEIFYRAPNGNGTQLVVAARDGSNVSSLFSGTASLYFSFDVGSQASGKIVIGSRAGELLLLTYAKNNSGVFARTSLTTLLTGIASGSNVALSPNGDRIAYRTADGTHLRVYTISDGSDVEWSTGPWAWDFIWARDGASIALLEQTDPVDGRSHLYEVTAPGVRTEILNMKYMDRVDVSHTDGNVLVLSYNSDDGQRMIVGTWRMPTGDSPAAWVNADLTGLTVANRGVLSCDDAYLIFGSSGKAGAQIWDTKTLPDGPITLINKVGSNADPRSWSSCATSAAQTNDAFSFRVPPK